MGEIKNKKLGYIVTLAYLVIFYSLNGTDYLLNFLLSIYQDKAFWGVIVNTVLYIIISMLFIGIYKDELLLWLKDFWDNKKKYSLEIVRCFILMYVALIITANILIIFGAPESQNQLAVRESSEENLILTLLTVVLLAPISEEFIYRLHIHKLLQGEKPQKLRKIIAYITGAVLFALYHTTIYEIINVNIGELISLMPYAVIGLFLIYLRDKTGNLICPILLHIVNNIIASIN